MGKGVDVGLGGLVGGFKGLGDFIQGATEAGIGAPIHGGEG